jgi:hypothetical protein
LYDGWSDVLKLHLSILTSLFFDIVGRELKLKTLGIAGDLLARHPFFGSF